LGLSVTAPAFGQRRERLFGRFTAWSVITKDVLMWSIRRQKLVTRIFAISLALAPLAAIADETSYTIPWKDVAAKDCSVVTDRGEWGVVILLRCKNHVDIVVVGQFAERTK
jgi:hypothetical protein